HFSIQNISQCKSSNATVYSNVIEDLTVESKKLPKEMLETNKTPTITKKLYYIKDTPSFTEMSESSRTKNPQISPMIPAIDLKKGSVPLEPETSLSDKDYLHEIMKSGGVKRKIQELETNDKIQTDAIKCFDLDPKLIDKSSSVQEVVYALEEKISENTVEAKPFAIRKREPSRAECDLPTLEKQILNEVDVQLTQLTTSEPPIEVVKLSPIEAVEKGYDNLCNIDEVICEKVCTKKKTFEVAEDPNSIDAYKSQVAEVDATNQKKDLQKNLIQVDLLPKVKNVVQVFEKQHPSSTLEAIPFSPKRQEIKKPAAIDHSNIDKQILTETDIILEQIVSFPHTEASRGIQNPTITSPQQSNTPIEESCEIVCSKRTISELAKIFEVPSNNIGNQTDEIVEHRVDNATTETEKTVKSNQLPKSNLTYNQTSISKTVDDNNTTLPLSIQKSLDNKQKFSISKEIWDNTINFSTHTSSDVHFPQGNEITAHADSTNTFQTYIRPLINKTGTTNVTLSKSTLETFTTFDDKAKEPKTISSKLNEVGSKFPSIDSEQFRLFKEKHDNYSTASSTEILEILKHESEKEKNFKSKKILKKVDYSVEEHLKQLHENLKTMSTFEEQMTQCRGFSGHFFFDKETEIQANNFPVKTPSFERSPKTLSTEITSSLTDIEWTGFNRPSTSELSSILSPSDNSHLQLDIRLDDSSEVSPKQQPTIKAESKHSILPQDDGVIKNDPKYHMKLEETRLGTISTDIGKLGSPSDSTQYCIHVSADNRTVISNEFISETNLKQQSLPKDEDGKRPKSITSNGTQKPALIQNLNDEKASVLSETGSSEIYLNNSTDKQLLSVNRGKLTSSADKPGSSLGLMEDSIQELADKKPCKTEELISETESEKKKLLPEDVKIKEPEIDKETVITQVRDDPVTTMSVDQANKDKLISPVAKQSTAIQSMESKIQESINKISGKTEDLISETELEKKASLPEDIKTKAPEIDKTALTPQKSDEPERAFNVDQDDKNKLTHPVDKPGSPIKTMEPYIRESADKKQGTTAELISQADSLKELSHPKDVKTKEPDLNELHTPLLRLVPGDESAIRLSLPNDIKVKDPKKYEKPTLTRLVSDDPTMTMTADQADQDNVTSPVDKPRSPTLFTESCIQKSADEISGKTEDLISETESETKPAFPIDLKTKGTEFDNATLIPQGSEETTKIRTLDQTDKGKLTSLEEKSSSSTESTESCIQESVDKISSITEELISETESAMKPPLPTDIKAKQTEFDNAALISQASDDPTKTMSVDQADQDNMTSPVDKSGSPTVPTESCIQESADQISGKTEELISETESAKKLSPPIVVKTKGTEFDKRTLLPQVSDDPTKTYEV
ncbi:hypothetical protein DOY81_007313, partial [Sarcophaga bullata]